MASKKRSKKPSDYIPLDDSSSYGVVVVMKGPHKGKVGYFDDDGDSGFAIVYVDGEPFTEGAPYYAIRYSSLRAATPAEVRLYQRTHGMRDERLATGAGVPLSARRRDNT